MASSSHSWCRLPWLRTFLLFPTCVAMAGCASTAPGSADLIGTAGFSCGLSDGPATLAHLQVENAPATWWIFNVEGAAPEELDGTYPINNGARSGSARLRVCDNALKCTWAVEGTIVVTGQRHGRFEGSLQYRLPDQALERRTFSASIERANVVCP